MRSRFWTGQFAVLALACFAAPLALAETHLGGVGPDGRPISPAASQAKFFQLVNSCMAGRGAGLGAGLGGGINPPPLVGNPDLSGLGGFAPPPTVNGLDSGSGAGLPPGDANRGNATFNAKCLSCHGPGRPQAGLNASGPKGAGRVVSTSAPMPPSGGLSAQEKADLVAFLNQRNGAR